MQSLLLMLDSLVYLSHSRALGMLPWQLLAPELSEHLVEGTLFDVDSKLCFLLIQHIIVHVCE